MILVASAAWIYFGPIYPKSSPQPNTKQSKPNKDDKANSARDIMARYLATTDEVDVYEQLKPEEQRMLVQAVQYFCEIDWDSDSCIHHMITCGKRCFNYLKPSVQDKVRETYRLKL